jgi:hypothetical protein
MPYCSINEAWGKGPEGIDMDTYQSVNYDDSSIYKSSGEPVFPKDKKQAVKRIPNMSRTQERLPQHGGPQNRYSTNETSVSLNYDDNNKFIIEQSEVPFSKKNTDVPISAYSKAYKSKHQKTFSTPIHEIRMRTQSYKKDKNAEDLNDTIDNIIKDIEKNESSADSSKKTVSKDAKSDDSSVSSESKEEVKPTPITSKFRDLLKKYKTKNDLIKYLIIQNEKLNNLVKKRNSKSGNGLFSSWDLLIVLLLGILMIIVLEYVYKIAINKSV